MLCEDLSSDQLVFFVACDMFISAFTYENLNASDADLETSSLTDKARVKCPY